MGRNGGPERKSEKKAAANRENAKKRRGLRARMATVKEREYFDRCVSLFRAGLPVGAQRLTTWLTDPESPPALFQWAMEFAADRAGLPRLSEQRVMAETITPLVVTLRGLSPPWLEATGSTDARGDRHDGEPQHLSGAN